MERVRNVIKLNGKREAEVPQAERPKKKVKKSENILKYYPELNPFIDDNESVVVHENAIKTELAKNKPRDSVLIPLMKSTFALRRSYEMEEASSVKNILEMYSALSRPAIVSYLYIL